GAWVGGLVGVCSENRKIRRFHDDIEAGKYLILVYARGDQEQAVQNMMDRLHPEAEMVGFDAKFYNPFTLPTPVTRTSHGGAAGPRGTTLAALTAMLYDAGD